MGESTCLMQSFSHGSDIGHDNKEGNPVPVLEGSISFGRFISESLSWEKWSSFSHNRYLEEVEKYSKPGSVAQKKAYFEAHYKRIAAKKAASLLEQANAAANDNGLEQETKDGVQKNATTATVSDLEAEADINNLVRIVDTKHELAESNGHLVVDGPEQVEAPVIGMDLLIEADGSKSDGKMDLLIDADESNSDGKMDLLIDADGSNSDGKMDELETTKVEEASQVVEDKVESSQQIGEVESHNKVVNVMELSKASQMEKLPLKESSHFNQAISATIKKKSTLPASKSSGLCRASKLQPSPAKPTTPVYTRKEISSTPNSKKCVRDSTEKRRHTPLALHLSINAAPYNAGEAPPLATIKRGSTLLKKIGDLKAVFNSYKTSHGGSSPLKTPTKVYANGAPKLPLMTPRSENRRNKTPLECTIPGSEKAAGKWQSFSVDRSKSSSTWGNKARSLIVSSSFSFKSEERAAKRKEYSLKLEERFSAKEAQKVQLQEKSKEKAEIELKKLRQSLGFKAKPMPDFYREIESPKNQIKKIPLTRPRSPKIGRKANPSAGQDTNSLPPRTPSVKSDCSKHFTEKNNNRTPNRSHTSFHKKNTHENTSPNIQP